MNRTLQSPERPEFEPAQPPMIYIRKPPKWEYKVATHQLPPGSHADENELNELGQDGWELAGIVHENSYTHFYFKRLIT